MQFVIAVGMQKVPDLLILNDFAPLFSKVD